MEGHIIACYSNLKTILMNLKREAITGEKQAFEEISMCQEKICCGGRAHPDFVSSHNGMETVNTKLPEFQLFHGGRSLLERL